MAAKRPGEGCFGFRARKQRHRYGVRDALRVVEKFVIPEPQHAKAPRAEPNIADLISTGFVMLAAICLDDQPGVVANEVRDIAPDRNLTPELCPSELPVAQDAPKRMFCIGHGVAQRAGMAETLGAGSFPLTRRPDLPGATLSREGRGFCLAIFHRAISQVVSISPVTGFFASFSVIPKAESSSRMRSASAQFFAFLA